ncbi:hypothetical protein C0991_012058 [Blastosporella zonata]|nr:hypothetical protein C0991_012058 [Blastosporella zonata]
MSIANDIRNAHNIPLIGPPPLPLYPPELAAEFQPRPAPPVPLSTLPPPRPPLPPSLTTSVLLRPEIASSPPPPIPPKPFSTPFQLHADGRPQLIVSTIPRALLPGGQPTIAETDDDIALVMALSASASDEEQSLRRKLTTQEDDDIARALEASMLDISDRPFTSLGLSASAANDQSAPSSQGNNNLYDEAFARSLATATCQSSDEGPSDSESSHSDQSVGSRGSALKKEAPTLTVSTQTSKQFSLSTDPELPGYSPDNTSVAQGLISLQGNIDYSASTSTPPREDRELRPPSPSDLAYLHHATEHDGDVTPRAERASVARNLNSFTASSTTFPWAPPEPNLNRNSSVPASSMSTRNAQGRQEPLKAAPSESAHLNLGSSSKAAYSGATLPSYTETSACVEESSQHGVTHTSEPPSMPQWNTVQPSLHGASRPSSSSSASSSHKHFPSPDVRVDAGTMSHLSRVSSAHPSLESHDDDDLDSARPGASAVNLNAFVNKELLNGVSVGFMAPKISSQLGPMMEEMPPIISLPYGKARPLHLLGPSWRHLLKLMASLSGTRMEASLEAMAATKTAPKLRTIIQFIKPYHASPIWRTIFYFTIDYPSLQPQARHRSVNDLPYSYSLAGVPTLLRDASDTAVSKAYTIPATDLLPLPTLPITFPDLAMYMQAALDMSRRYLNDSHSDYRKLAKMITTCYPDDDVPHDPSERRGLFQRVMGRSNKAPRRGGNEDTYELVTPFVPDEWG